MGAYLSKINLVRTVNKPNDTNAEEDVENVLDITRSFDFSKFYADSFNSMNSDTSNSEISMVKSMTKMLENSNRDITECFHKAAVCEKNIIKTVTDRIKLQTDEYHIPSIDLKSAILSDQKGFIEQLLQFERQNVFKGECPHKITENQTGTVPAEPATSNKKNIVP